MGHTVGEPVQFPFKGRFCPTYCAQWLSARSAPVVVRVESLNNAGAVNRDIWDAEAMLSADAGVTLSTNRVVLRNGVGTALLAVTGTTDFNLTATLFGNGVSKTLQNLSSAPVTTLSGTLPGSSTTGSGVVNVTGNVTVPSGRTLTIRSNTLVIINGVASGTSGARIIVNGTIQSLGTESHPVSITCANASQNWGQIRHDNAQPSTYRGIFISKAGRAPGEGHTGTGPAIRPNNSTLHFENCISVCVWLQFRPRSPFPGDRPAGLSPWAATEAVQGDNPHSTQHGRKQTISNIDKQH